jgi:hypothetical protein
MKYVPIIQIQSSVSEVAGRTKENQVCVSLVFSFRRLVKDNACGLISPFLS